MTSQAPPKVVVISTGGTIASRFDAATGRTVASQRGEDLLAQVPGLAAVAALEIDDFATIPSFDLTVEARVPRWRCGSTSSSRGRT